MVIRNRVAVLTFTCMSLIMRAQGIIPAPDATATPPTDLSSLAATPTPDASGAATPASPEATASAPATSEIQPEQMKGDGILELSEEQPAELLPSGNAQIGSLASQAKNITDELSKTIEQITQQHAQLQGQFGQIQTELDAFYQTSGAQRGKIGEMLEEVAQPLTPQTTIPTIVTPNAGTPTAPATPITMPGMTIPPM